MGYRKSVSVAVLISKKQKKSKMQSESKFIFTEILKCHLCTSVNLWQFQLKNFERRQDNAATSIHSNPEAQKIHQKPDFRPIYNNNYKNKGHTDYY